ncbi:hypothetical protein HDV57DRAFT_498989 [Trichoderma longibrachiatum]|uniref:Uncharacterized protein n=1 Tax=Trichoderma longibrachiatum ATCC 18648 TaxID=983965 RepID=A0A2T4C8X3_TRILO|nr:hypothetical protein M440DRAFT_1399207 [Trichoderma longibrachiatum ATCC 18648]
MAAIRSIFQVSPIDFDLFFAVDDKDLLLQIYDRFSHELDRLQSAYSISDASINSPGTQSPSQLLYGTQYDEVNRTLVSILSLRWIYNDQYERFAATQPDKARLTRSSFNWIRTKLLDYLKSPVDLYTLLAYAIAHDLGKSPSLASDYYRRTGTPIAAENHDLILLRAVNIGLVPCIDSLPLAQRTDVVHSIQIGAEFNIGQAAQAECPPASLSVLLSLKGHERAFELQFMHQMLDIAGAAGHEDWSCAKKLVQPIFEAHEAVYDAATQIIRGERRLRDGYDAILQRRAGMLHGAGFRALDIGSDEDRALSRILCMGGVSSLEMAKLYGSVWDTLDANTTRCLVHSLNVDGSVAEPAVQPTYMPAMLTLGLDAAFTSSEESKATVLKVMLGYLARVMTLTDQQDGRAIIIERSVLWVVKDVVQSAAFRDDPKTLERADVPASVLLKSETG